MNNQKRNQENNQGLIVGDLKDTIKNPELLKKHGFNHLGITLKKFKSELDHRLSNYKRLRELKVPILLKPYDLAIFFEIHYFSLKKYCIKKESISPLEFLYNRFIIKKKYKSRQGPRRDKYNYYMDINYERVNHREILTPKYPLYQIQKKIFSEILAKIEPNENAHGFRKNHSIVTNALKHLDCKIIYNIDLQNFFPSIKYDKVLELFKNIGYSGLISSLLSSLCTFAPRRYDKNKKKWILIKTQIPFLPQGACTSPIISNLVCKNLDSKLNILAQENGFVYTRYADDITFSSRIHEKIKKEFRSAILNIIKSDGFRINRQKEKITQNKKNMVITGLVIHKEELGLPRKWVMNLRAAIHNLKNDRWNIEDPNFLKILNNIEGRCAYAMMVNKKKYSHFFYEFKYLKNLNFKNSG